MPTFEEIQDFLGKPRGKMLIGLILIIFGWQGEWSFLGNLRGSIRVLLEFVGLGFAIWGIVTVRLSGSSRKTKQKKKKWFFQTGLILVSVAVFGFAINETLIDDWDTSLGQWYEGMTSSRPVVTPPISTNTPVPTDAPTPTNTPTPEVSGIIKILDEYFQLINNAGNKLDLQVPWNYLSRGFQCRLSSCDIEEYKDFWWSFRIEYKLYDCDTNKVDAELTYFGRSNDDTPNQTKILRYGFDSDMKIDSGVFIEGTSCTLVIDSGEEND